MAYSNIDIQKFLPDKSDASMTTIGRKCSDPLLLDMLAEGLFADITLQAKGGTVKAHRNVLATASPVFRKMFQAPLPSVVSLHELRDITIESLELFLVSLYISNEKTKPVPEFIAAVDKHFTVLFDATLKLKVEVRLNAVLKSGLLRHLTPENCWDFYHKCKDSTWTSEHAFSEACLSYATKNIKAVMTSATTLLEMQRNPQVVQHCVLEALSRGLCCDSSRQKTTSKRKTQNA